SPWTGATPFPVTPLPGSAHPGGGCPHGRRGRRTASAGRAGGRGRRVHRRFHPVLAADVLTEGAGRGEDLVPELPEPGKVGRGRVELEDDGIAQSRLQALRPARLGDGEHLAGRRI